MTHLNTARNSLTKKPSVTFSAAMRNLPSLFIDVTPIFLDLAGAILGALFLLFRKQPYQLIRHSRDLLPPQHVLQVPLSATSTFLRESLRIRGSRRRSLPSRWRTPTSWTHSTSRASWP